MIVGARSQPHPTSVRQAPGPRPAAPAPAQARPAFTPSRPVGRFAPPPTPQNFHASPASHTTHRIAAKIAGKSSAPRGPVPGALGAAIAMRSRLAAQAPFTSIASSDLLQSRPLRQLMFQGQFNQEFQTLKNQGLIPANAKQPPLAFPLRGKGAAGDLSFETGSADARNARVHISPSVLFQATQNSGFVPARSWALETPIHELAHALQKPGVLKNKALREGGAQAFADAASIKAIGPISQNDTNYSGYVRNVRSKRGAKFFMRGQFG